MFNIPDPLLLQLEWVFPFKLAERTREKHKLARVYHVPYQVTKLTFNSQQCPHQKGGQTRRWFTLGGT